LKERFEQVDDEYLEFERIPNPMHRRPDLCAMLMLAAIVPRDSGDILAASEHDEVFFDVDTDALNDSATDDQIRDLARCGVMCGDSEDLSLFV
jgi:hypothetical protein